MSSTPSTAISALSERLEPLTRSPIVQRLRPYTRIIVTSTAALLVLFPLYSNYSSYLALGPGGLPHNIWGWLCATALKPFGRETLGTAVYEGDPDTRHFLAPETVPMRSGARPPTGWHFVPHRQLAESAPPAMQESMVEAMRALANGHPDKLVLGPSPNERQHEGLLVHPNIPTHLLTHASIAARREIAHVHQGSDGSLHAVLAPADCRTLIEKGWAQRHPLAGTDTLGIESVQYLQLPKEYVMLYAPRDAEEAALLTRVLRAAASYAVGEELST